LEKKKLSGDPVNVKNSWQGERQVVKKTEPDSSQQCPVAGQEGKGKN